MWVLRNTMHGKSGCCKIGSAVFMSLPLLTERLKKITPPKFWHIQPYPKEENPVLADVCE